MTRVFIDGAAGTTGLEIDARLAGRDCFELIRLDEAHRKDTRVRREALNDADIVILCLPDDAARDAVALIENSRTRVIDASSAHRVAPDWTYGFPELGHNVASAARVSNPGCYPTGFLALVAPLVRGGIVPAEWPLSVNAISGYSGGGKALIARFDAQPGLGWRGYGHGLDHKHLPEMRIHAGLTHAPVFAPAVARAYRGMVVEVPLHLSALPRRPERAALVATLKDFYAGSAIVTVHEDVPPELLLGESDKPSDRLDLYVFANANQARLVAVLDNLGKGAGGTAVQSLNLMTGRPETEGLRL